MRLRRRPSVLVFLACLALTSLAHAAAAGIEFVRVWPGWRDAEAFESISEYFSGEEKNLGRVVLRTHADTRAGFYYLVRVANSTAARTDTKFSLQLITPDSPDVKTYTFAAALPGRSTVFHLGLTGADWPDAKVHPVAWKLDLLGANDEVLATTQSFLWSKPAR